MSVPTSAGNGREAVDALITLLEEELALLRRLGDCLSEQTAAIVTGDTTKLSALQVEAEKVTAHLESVDHSRRELAAAQTGDDGEPLSLSALAGTLPERQARRLERVRRRLLDAHARAERARMTNQRLLHTALELTQTTLSAVVHAAMQTDTYGPAGGASCGPAPTLLINEDA